MDMWGEKIHRKVIFTPEELICVAHNVCFHWKIIHALGDTAPSNGHTRWMGTVCGTYCRSGCYISGRLFCKCLFKKTKKNKTSVCLSLSPCSLSRHTHPIATAVPGPRDVQTLLPASLSSSQPFTAALHTDRPLTSASTLNTDTGSAAPYSSSWWDEKSESYHHSASVPKPAFSPLNPVGASMQRILNCPGAEGSSFAVDFLKIE